MIKVNYDIETTLVKGYYPNTINYVAIPEPYIEISNGEHQAALNKTMCVVDGIFQEYVLSQSEQLAQAKDAKIIQLKTNRNTLLQQPMASIQAFEVNPETQSVLSNLVYFEFNTERTTNGLTDPATIVFTALSGSNIIYSCKIIEGSSTRAGYVQINKSVAETIMTHLQQRATSTIRQTNTLEAEIEACEDLEELNTININFA
jgi:formylmethanofuran dehydrogenase subunit A